MSDYSKKINQKPVNLPEDLNKPFFAYGIFKKGQIAYSKIEDCVRDVDDADDVELKDCEMKIRDGVPLISDYKSEGYRTKGQIIWFLDEQKERAYKIISDTEPDDLYEWGETNVKGIEVNVLYGKKPGDGSYTYETDGGRYVDNFDGKNDLFFKDLFEFLRLESEKLDGGEYDLFRLQMYYMILWSVIDRYCSLKYDSINFKGDDIRNLSNDPVFIKSINSFDLPNRKPIYSSRDGKPWEWRNSTYSKLNYYYKLRGNVIHRGKDRLTNTDILHLCFDELLKIFKKVIDKTFSQDDD